VLYAIFSDIHGNREALTAVLDHARRKGVGRYVCLGDVVGYGPEPSECLAMLREVPGLLCLKGNHEAALLGEEDDAGYNENARAALAIHRERLSREEKDYLAGLEPRVQESGFLFVHASPRDPLHEYLTSSSRIRESLGETRTGIVFGGHTHQPLVFSRNREGMETVFFPRGAMETLRAPRPTPGPWKKVFDSLRGGRPAGAWSEKSRRLESGSVHFVNDGSAGQPRDGDPRACYVLFDSAESTVEFNRLPYDIPAVQRKIRRAGLPDFLAWRLENGI